MRSDDESAAISKAVKAIQCQVELQKRAGGNANIGRSLYPLLTAADFHSIQVSPRMVYVNSSKPQLVEGFIKNTFTAMIEGIRESSCNLRCDRQALQAPVFIFSNLPLFCNVSHC
jgi:hypothetical protein